VSATSDTDNSTDAPPTGSPYLDCNISIDVNKLQECCDIFGTGCSSEWISIQMVNDNLKYKEDRDRGLVFKTLFLRLSFDDMVELSTNVKFILEIIRWSFLRTIFPRGHANFDPDRIRIKKISDIYIPYLWNKDFHIDENIRHDVNGSLQAARSGVILNSQHDYILIEYDLTGNNTNDVDEIISIIDNKVKSGILFIYDGKTIRTIGKQEQVFINTPSPPSYTSLTWVWILIGLTIPLIFIFAFIMGFKLLNIGKKA